MNYTYQEVIINDKLQCIARSDGLMIPLDNRNVDYVEYLRWQENQAQHNPSRFCNLNAIINRYGKTMQGRDTTTRAGR